ncbi:MAG: RlmE family RNA methyltransferase [Nitrosomonas sp.]|nr:RlmE family RNA methyltransferase [Nitrosomonas sp.]
MKHAKTSKKWIKEHVNDFYVKQAKKDGYRSRAAYKLLEIADRYQLLKPGMTVVDLGASPGSWSQVVIQKTGRKGKLIALDLLDMEPLQGMDFIQGDFRETVILNALEEKLGNCSLDLVISDMSPNVSGIGISDQARSIHLAELALAFSMERLNPGKNFLVKVFQGRDFDQLLCAMRLGFHQVLIRKPKASRDRSKELYLLGLGKK